MSDHVEAVERIVRQQLPEGAPTLESVAEGMGVSARTLKRRLREADRTYSGLVCELRFEHAARLLATTDTPIASVAEQAGYGLASNFTRAFVRIFGETPRQYRAVQRSGRK